MKPPGMMAIVISAAASMAWAIETAQPADAGDTTPAPKPDTAPAVQTDPAGIGAWTTDYPAAAKVAADRDLPIFLQFTGSDWCGWCQYMEKQCLSKPEFLKAMRTQCVLVSIDFPQKTKLPAALADQNKKLAQQFKKTQGMPSYILVDSDGKTVRWQFGAHPKYGTDLNLLISDIGEFTAGCDGVVTRATHGMSTDKAKTYLDAAKALLEKQQAVMAWLATNPSGADAKKQMADYHAEMKVLHAKMKAIAGSEGPTPKNADEADRKLDKNGDGKISLEEFYLAGPEPLHPRMKQVFESLDTAHAGALSFADTAKAVSTVNKVEPNFTPQVDGVLKPIPLKVHPKTKRAFINAKVNGIEGVFLLDTGTDTTILAPAFAKRAGVDFVEVCLRIIRGNMGEHGSFVSFVRVPDMIIEGTHFRDFHAILRELQKPAYEFGSAIDGILGADVIFAKPVTLDFRHGVLAFAMPGKGGDGIELSLITSLRKEEKKAQFEADVDGVKFNLMLDSGAAIGNAILLNEPYHDAIRKLAGDPNATTYTAKSLKAGGQELESNVLCRILPFPCSVVSSVFFDRHVISVDTAAGRAVIKRCP